MTSGTTRPIAPDSARKARRGFRGLTVQAWFLLALVLMGVVAAVAAAVGTRALDRTETANVHLVDDIAPARAEAFQLKAALLDQETGVRGYLLTADPDLLEPYYRGVTTEERSRNRLDELMGAEKGPAADLAAVEEAAETWRTEFAEPAIAARKLGPVEAPAAGKTAFDRVRSSLDAQHTRLVDERAKWRDELTEAREHQDFSLALILATFLAAAVGLAVLIHFAVGRPLSAVRSASQRVADGEFQHHIPLQGPADLQALAEAVEAMRVRVVADLDASQRNEATLTQQAADLEEQRVELERSNAELEQFAYVASHDLQEPLRKVASFCQLLEKRYGEELDDRGKQYIGFAVDGAKRMQILINDLLTFSRVGRLHDSVETVPLDSAFDRAVRDLSVTIADSGASVDKRDELPSVQGDPTLFAMLWQNLIGNAVKFRSPDRTPHITVTAEPDDQEGFWRFAVTDNGIGIPAEFADKVFVIFQRLHSRDSYSGTGIGLSLCKKIIEHSGGRIWVDTDHTEGTRIVFTLPVAASPAEPAESAADASALPSPVTTPAPEGKAP
ncbi:ATP-binding protein [Streptomyces sp. NPDC005963]|uniref:sensor histidine kinase n=1 Tax=Streptomyces sp. NPDC005963 TaxID=3156721 RepID=UPI0033D28173